MNLHIIGLGGIGSHLLFPLIQYLNYEKKNVFESIILTDGDSYEQKNVNRQFITGLQENKAVSQAKYYREMFEDIKITFFDQYITKENINSLIQDGDVVLLCVDNHKTRKVLEDFSETVQNTTIISGGNELTDGNVMIIHKRNNIYETPKFSEIHEELLNPTDKSPDEMSCEELEKSAPQISIVNAAMADVMRQSLYGMMNEGIRFYEVMINVLAANNKYKYFEITDPMNIKRIKIC